MSRTTTARCDEVAHIAAVVMEHYGISDEDFYSPARRQPIATARQVAMYLARTLTDLSLPEIGAALERDHTTVMHGIEATRERLARDPDFLGTVGYLHTLAVLP